MQCPHCNQKHPEGTQFCPMTGKKILIPAVCPECGKPVNPNWLHCSYCGRTLIQAEGISNRQETQATGYPPSPVTIPGLSKTETSFSKVRRLMIAGGIGVLLIIAGIVLIVVGRGKNNGDATSAAILLPAATLASTSAPTLAPVPPTPVEKYEQVDPSKLLIDFQADIPGEVRWDAAGNITAFGGGKVTRFTVGGKPIELVSDDMLLEEKEVFIVTKDYGKIKVTFNSNFTISLWLKPSQKAELLRLIK